MPYPAFDVMLATGIPIEALPLRESEWEPLETFGNPTLTESFNQGAAAHPSALAARWS